jgi:O-antigen ligase
MQFIVLMLLFVCFFVIGNGAAELHRGLPATRADPNSGMAIPYFEGMYNAAGEWFYRLRGLGEINDPNDFAQLIVCVVPLTFFFWKRKKFVRNFVFVLIPVGVLVWGAYLTRSRGSMLALLAVVIVAFRRRIGTIPAVILAIALFFAASALHYTGGRDISASAGEDREQLWGEGLELLKTHPLFGVGFEHMTDFAEQTAHNSIIVCGAELGLVGLYFWSMFLLPSVRDALAVASPEQVTERMLLVPDSSPYGLSTKPDAKLDKSEINRLGRLLVLSFTGFLVTGWFLSRAFVMTLFLLGGLTEALYQVALTNGMISPRLPFGRVARYAGIMTVALVVVMYIVTRLLNVMH